MAGGHTETSPDEKGTTTDLLHSDERDGCKDDVDQVKNQGDQEGVLNSASRLKERSGVVENEVDT